MNIKECLKKSRKLNAFLRIIEGFNALTSEDTAANCGAIILKMNWRLEMGLVL